MVRIFLLVVFLVIASDIQGRVLEKRIIHGTEAKPGAWPWMVYVETLNPNKTCGGTILSNNWIMTSSHCIDENPTLIAVVAGAHTMNGTTESSQQIRTAMRHILHPKYRRSDLYADIALIEIYKPFWFNDRVNKASLPGCNDYPLVGMWCYTAGWGYTQYDPKIRPDKLQQARLPILGVDDVEHILAGFGVQGKASVCQGDSGGPLMCKAASGHWIVEGTLSWVLNGCHSVSGFTPLAKYLNWVKQYVPI
ncbi:chymotrypsinogen A-like [Clytia hemisphaerica]|uniref:Peptidase S1 domain-containing protein n=1 Tax=Clytia hemisphaerica TaxID=252671 RepID=A0A7M5V0C9_9CNID